MALEVAPHKARRSTRTTVAESLGACLVLCAVATAVPVLTGPASASSGGSRTGSQYVNGPGATRLAGTGVPGDAGDGGPALRAELDQPVALAADRTGDIFVADSGDCRVREIAARAGVSFGRRLRRGEIVTVAGGPCGEHDDHAPTGLATDARGDLFIAYGPANQVDEVAAYPHADLGQHLSTGRLTRVAGTGTPGFEGDGTSAVRNELDDPSAIALDGTGDLLISDTANCRVRLVANSHETRFGTAMTDGDIYTVAGNGICGSADDGGPALDAEIWDPGALAVDRSGDVVVADQGNRTIREIASHSGTFYGVAISAGHMETVAGEGSYGPYLSDGLPALGQVGEVDFPTAIALDAQGDMYIADGAMHAIRLVASSDTVVDGRSVTSGDMYTVAGAISSGSLHNRTEWVRTRMADPTGLVVENDGLLYCDGEANVVRKLSYKSRPVRRLVPTGATEREAPLRYWSVSSDRCDEKRGIASLRIGFNRA